MASLDISGPAQIYDPSVDLTDVPIFPDILVFENTAQNPVYMWYMDARSAPYLAMLDQHINLLKENFQGPHPGFNFPHIEIILDILEERRRQVLLEDCSYIQEQRIDLDDIFENHRVILESFLHQLNLLKQMFNRLANLPNPFARESAVNALLVEYTGAYEQFSSTLPEYVATYQEAITGATQANLISD